MNSELRRKVMDIPASREVNADLAAIVDIAEGEPNLLEKVFPFTEVPAMAFEGKAMRADRRGAGRVRLHRAQAAARSS